MNIIELGDITLYNDDCFTVLPKLESNNIDMVFADLPYGTTACKWDSILDLTLLWSYINKITRSNASQVFTASFPFTATLTMSNIKNFRYEWIWEKEQGVNFLLAKKQPMKVHENILVFCKETTPYYPIMTIGKPYISGKGNSGEVTGSVTKIQTKNEGTRYPRSIIKINRETGLHPTQKPVELLEYLIKTYTNEEDTVLDPTMGSGTTALACARLNRKCIGIEKDRDYFDIAVNRVLGEII